MIVVVIKTVDCVSAEIAHDRTVTFEILISCSSARYGKIQKTCLKSFLNLLYIILYIQFCSSGILNLLDCKNWLLKEYNTD